MGSRILCVSHIVRCLFMPRITLIRLMASNVTLEYDVLPNTTSLPSLPLSPQHDVDHLLDTRRAEAFVVFRCQSVGIGHFVRMMQLRRMICSEAARDAGSTVAVARQAQAQAAVDTGHASVRSPDHRRDMEVIHRRATDRTGIRSVTERTGIRTVTERTGIRTLHAHSVRHGCGCLTPNDFRVSL